MKLNKITLNNIRSYENQEVEFSEGSTLLSGDIGSGKTSILLAIEFALFGLQPGQRGSSILRNGEKTGGVKIEFEVDGKKIFVERTLKKAKTITQDYCAIIIDGEKKEISVTELKNQILGLLNYPKEFAKKQNILYKFTVYTPQEEMKQIILQDSEARINTLRHVFGIDKYKRILENTSIVAMKIREEKRIKEAMTTNLDLDKLEIVSKENDVLAKEDELRVIEKELLLKIEEMENKTKEKDEIDKKRQEKIKLSQEVEKTRIMIANKNESILANEKIISQLKFQIKEFQEMKFDSAKILEIENKIGILKKEKEKLSDDGLSISSQRSSLIFKNDELKKLEQKLSNLESCPTCLQTVDAVYRANVLNKSHNDVAGNNKKIEILESEKKQIFDKIKNNESMTSSLENELTDLKILKMKLEGIYEKQARLEETEKSNEALKKDIELLKRHVESLHVSVFELNKFDKIFEEKQKELNNALRQEKMAEIKVAELKKEIEGFLRQINELREKVEKTEAIKKELIYLSEMEDWLSKKFISVISYIEKNVMIKLKSDFSRLFSEWFSMLVSESFNVKLSDDFTPIIEQQDYDIDYAYLSGGERTAIALAYRLALNQVINSVLSKIKTKDLVILDEPTDGFSEQQLDKMRDVLQELNVKQLIIVSHEQKIEGFVENVIRFSKNNGVSKKE